MRTQTSYTDPLEGQGLSVLSFCTRRPATPSISRGMTYGLTNGVDRSGCVFLPLCNRQGGSYSADNRLHDEQSRLHRDNFRSGEGFHNCLIHFSCAVVPVSAQLISTAKGIKFHNSPQPIGNSLRLYHVMHGMRGMEPLLSGKQKCPVSVPTAVRLSWPIRQTWRSHKQGTRLPLHKLSRM